MTRIMCENEKWGKLPHHWKCVDQSIVLPSELRAEELRNLAAELLLDETERRDKALLEEEKNYFLIVTVPAMAGEYISLTTEDKLLLIRIINVLFLFL